MRSTYYYLRTVGLFLLLCFISTAAFAQTISVSGTVKDATGDPVIGASIIEPGTSNGTMTDVDGNYTLKVSPQGKFTVSYVGFHTQEVVVSGRNRIDVVLEETSKSLNEVVVIGYGTQRREAVTGSVASMQGNVIRDVPAGNITNALQGRIPGVVMTQTDSKPGANMQIRIRGTRSLNATNDPLVVLDGIPYAGSIGDINPTDIKSIDILKDASATAIYGSRGANGVIMVTTYKGVAGQQARVTYDGYYGIETLFHKIPLMTGDELARVRIINKDRYMNIDAQGNPTPKLGADEVLGQNTDWQDLMYKDGYVTSHNLSVSGGTDMAAYSFGAGYYKQTSLLPGQNYDRINLRGSFDQQIGKYVRLGLTTNSNYSRTNGQNLSLVNTLLLSPLINPYNADGTWKGRGSSVEDSNVWLYSRASTEALGDDWADNQKNLGTYNSLYGEVKIPGVEGLSYRINLGLNYWNLNRGQYKNVGVLSDNAEAVPNASQQRNETTNWTVENLLTYDKYFNKHHINLTGLYSAERTTYTKLLLSANNIAAPFFQYYNLGQAPAGDIMVKPGDQDYQQYGLESVMGRVMYDYDSRYMLSVSFRSDGSSRLAPGHKWHSYPAVSAGWNISREAFMENINWIDNLKLRVGWGQTSNQAVDPYSTLGLLDSSRPYNFGTTLVPSYYVSLAPNPNLGWEYSKTWNFGVDFGLFNNRLSGSVDYYIVKTDDLLYKVPLPKTSGTEYQWANVGKSQNKGVEITLNGSIFDNPNGWSWDVGVNFAANSNKITALSSGVRDDKTNWWFVGHPVNVIYDLKKIGIWQESEADMVKQYEGSSGVPGQIKVLYTGDYNADGSPTRYISDDDRQIMKVDPDWQGGFSTRVAYKDWDLNVIGAYQHGGTLISNLHSSTSQLDMLTGRRGQMDVDYWTPDNPGGTYPMPGTSPGESVLHGSTLGYFSASYLKVSTITLGYNFNRNMEWIKNLGVQNARLYFTVQNAFVLFSPFRDECGLDPVPNSFVDQNSAVTSTYNNTKLLMVGSNAPQTRNFILGLNVSF
ncbi:MAG: TonB-dependent receptor [Candidatus Azobacteroides sp.]|nr:TonB-dependent receptor [Candidatus Azobacteroides sp.]